MSTPRLWLFRITAVLVIPALFLVFLETGLRLLGVGYPTRFLFKCEVNGQVAYCNNDKFSWLFFPPRVARLPYPFVIPAEKPRETYRIFLLGGSAAQGDPEHTFGVTRILGVMLQEQYPGINFELINAALTAINSHAVLQIAKDVARHQSNLFVVYLGNNEVVGPFGAGTVFAPLSSNLSLIRASIALKSTRIGQTLERLVQLVGRERAAPGEWSGMEMFIGKQVRVDDPGIAHVYSHFQKNLEGILRVARKAGIETIVSTVGSNLKDNAPFASLHRLDISEDEKKAWDDIYHSGIELESQGMYAKAIQRYLEAVPIDDRFADLQYRLGRCYWTLGDYDSARERYIQARDLDTLRFRADTKINNIIRRVADGRSAEGIYLLDASNLFAENSPQKTPGKQLFYDHVHMNFRGNYILAEALFQQVVKILPDWVHRAQSEPELLTQEECARRLAFTGYDRYRVAAELLKRFGRAPFSNQIYHEEQIRQEKQNLNGLEIYTSPKALVEAASQYQAAIQNADTDPWLHYNYAQLLQASQNLQPASDELRFFLRYFPQHAPSYEKLAKILIIQGKFEEAITQCKKALRLKPQFASVLYHMAFALAKQGKFDQGIEKYQKLIDLDPQKSIDIYNQIGKIQAHQGKFEEAAETFRRAIEFNADSEFNKAIPDVHFNLGYVLKRLGKPDEATRELQKAIQGYRNELNENPNLAETHTVLGKALVEIGNYKDATEHYQQAIDLDPTNLTKHTNLIRVLEIQGRFDEAIEASRQAAGVMLNHGQKEAAAKLQRHLKTLESRK